MSRFIVSVGIALMLSWSTSLTASAAPPTNGKIAYVSKTDYQIWVMNPDGTNQTQLTHFDVDVDGVFSSEPEWSPDGSKIAYVRSGDFPSEIWVMNADGSGQAKLAQGEDKDWSPNGSKIAYEASGAIWVMNSDGTGKRRIIADATAPDWSPAGSKILYSRFDGVSKRSLWVANADGTGQARLVPDGYNEAWSPDGSRISFSWYDQQDLSYIRVMNADGSGKRDLDLGFPFEWSPVGSRIALVTFRTPREIWSAPSDGSEWTQVAADAYYDLDGPVWSPDGSKLAYERSADIKQIWVVNADGSGKTRLAKDSWSGLSWGTHPADPLRIAGAFTALTPSRLLDTRYGIGAPKVQVGAGRTVSFQVSGAGGVPGSGVSAVVLNVTATRGSKAGFVSAFPAGIAKPAASNVAFAAGQTIATHVTVKVGTAGGKVSLFNGSSAPVDLIADVAGWYRDGPVTQAGMFGPVAPARLVNAVGVGAKGTLPVAVTGRAGIPSSGVGAGAFNVTVAAPAKNGYITAFPNGTARPNASNVNFLAGQTIANAATSKLGSDGRLALFNGSDGTTKVTADVAGWFKAGTATSSGGFTSVAPARILDTRNGIGAAKAQVAAGKTVTLTVAGKATVPASGVGAAVLNVTVTRPGAGGYVTAFPTGGTKPNASNINFVAGQTIPNLVTVKLGGGKVTFYNGSTKPLDLITDIAGWYRG